MTGQCCLGGSASSRFARRLSHGAASILPGMVVALLPKCPLCVAAWLTAATGVGFSAGGARSCRSTRDHTLLFGTWLPRMSIFGAVPCSPSGHQSEYGFQRLPMWS